MAHSHIHAIATIVFYDEELIFLANLAAAYV
jgi:hypothetical protein